MDADGWRSILSADTYLKIEIRLRMSIFFMIFLIINNGPLQEERLRAAEDRGNG